MKFLPRLIGITAAVALSVAVFAGLNWRMADAQSPTTGAPINLNNPAGQRNLNTPGIPQEQFAAGLQEHFAFRNLLIGGDFGTNPWQRGTTFVSITNTISYTADRWFAYSVAGGDITVARSTLNTPTGYSAWMQFGRSATNVSTTNICMAQIVESAQATAAQGKPLAFSFLANAGANFSAANSQINVSLIAGTGLNDGAASLATSSWAGQTYLISATALTITTTATASPKYKFIYTGPVASTVNELAVQICYTPVGTAGANDYILLNSLQLEAAGDASFFEHRSPASENQLAQRYLYVLTEPVTNVLVGLGQATSTTVCRIATEGPVTMRITPTLRVLPNAVGNGFKVLNASGTAQAVTSITSATGQTPSYLSLLVTTGGLVAGNACLLTGSGGTVITSPAGQLLFDAELN